jgi:hypothetical protein
VIYRGTTPLDGQPSEEGIGIGRWYFGRGGKGEGWFEKLTRSVIDRLQRTGKRASVVEICKNSRSFRLDIMARKSNAQPQTSSDESLAQVQEPITSASPPVRQIIDRVLELEQERLDKNDRGLIQSEILNIVKEAVQ